MDEPAHDDRLRRLQRIAYGAVASDAERAAAVAELDALRRESSEAEAGADREPETPEPVRERTPTGSTRAVSEWIAASDAASVRRFRWAVAAGTAALLVGIGVGWQLGARMSTSEPSAAAVSAAPELDGFMVPVDRTRVVQLFEHAPGPADVPQSPGADPRIAPTDYRLLVTRADGVALHVARLDGGADVCAVLAVPGALTMGSCTQDGRFSEGGLVVEAFIEGDVGLIRGIIHPDGTSELTPSHYVPGPLQVAEG